MKDKNSKSYKQARRQKAIAFGRKASALHKKRKAEEYALLLEMRAQHPTPKGKGMRIKRRMALRVLEALDLGVTDPMGHDNSPKVKFCLQNRKMIMDTPHIRSYEFEVTRGQ